MPDIQTALKSALSRTLQQWDDDDEGTNVPVPSSQPVSISVSAPSQNIQGIPQAKPMTKNLFPIRNNVTRTTFNYVRDNPGSTRKEIIIALEHLGFNESSTSSILSQLCKNKMAHTTNGLYYADVTEYVPMKNTKVVKKKPAPPVVEVKPKRKYTKRSDTAGGIGALLKAKIESAPVYVPSETPPVVPQRKGFVSLVRNRTPESVIDNMTVYQARELYDHLKKLFGG